MACEIGMSEINLLPWWVVSQPKDNTDASGSIQILMTSIIQFPLLSWTDGSINTHRIGVIAVGFGISQISIVFGISEDRNVELELE